MTGRTFDQSRAVLAAVFLLFVSTVTGGILQISDFYSADGTGNNLQNPLWGAAGTLMSYEGIIPLDITAFETERSARAISNIIATAPHGQPRVTPRNTTDYGTAWAQFIDHDITLTPTGTERFDIPIPTCDRYFDPTCSGNRTMPFARTASTGPFQHPSIVTPWIDGSQIYGSSVEVQTALRSFVGGKLRTSTSVTNDEGDWPPRVGEISFRFRQYFSDVQNEARALPTELLFACGDVRCNEQPLLLSLQVLFLREHNRVADVLAENNPTWDDEELFQQARSYVVAELQHITFNEYLFWLLGGQQFEIPYTGYQPTVKPDIHVVFSTSAFRYGHSEVNEQIKRIIRGGFGDFAKNFFSSLSEHFFDNRLVTDDGLGPIFEGMAAHAQSSMDEQFCDAIRNDLFRGNGPRHFDLMAMDIQRARDHGVPKYNDVRVAFGLPRVATWAEFRPLNLRLEVDPTVLLNTLQELYPTPDDCDFFICGLSEFWVFPTAGLIPGDYYHIGESFEAVILKQFAALRDGDRLWYEEPSNLARLRALPGLQDVTTRLLSHVIRDNVPGVEIIEHVFFNEDLNGQSPRFVRPAGANPSAPLFARTP